MLWYELHSKNTSVKLADGGEVLRRGPNTPWCLKVNKHKNIPESQEATWQFFFSHHSVCELKNWQTTQGQESVKAQRCFIGFGSKHVCFEGKQDLYLIISDRNWSIIVFDLTVTDLNVIIAGCYFTYWSFKNERVY